MRASQEVRWKQHIKENEQRRRLVPVFGSSLRLSLAVQSWLILLFLVRRYDEASKRIENEQQTQVSFHMAEELLRAVMTKQLVKQSQAAAY